MLIQPDPRVLLKLARTRMPYGKYKDCLLVDLPEPYVVWMSRKGFPPGRLGEMLQMVYEIKVNGLEYLFRPFKDDSMQWDKKAVVLSSGGLDSTTAMAIARAEGYEIYSLSFSYGQRHSVELEAAAKVAAALGVKKHLVIDIDLKLIGGSALTDDIEVPKDRDESDMAAGIPVTYVPARNTIFLSYALGWAEVIGAGDIFIGVNAVDYSGYPDCRPEFIEAFERLANLATKAAVEGKAAIRIQAPLLHLSKARIIQKGAALGVDYSLTLSCYDPDPAGLACGHCDSCLLRRKGFLEAGIEDPTRYA